MSDLVSETLAIIQQDVCLCKKSSLPEIGFNYQIMNLLSS